MEQCLRSTKCPRNISLLVTVWIREGVVKEWEKTKVKPEFGGNCGDSDVISGDRKTILIYTNLKEASIGKHLEKQGSIHGV